jgi:hypothetical protein
VLAKYSTPLDYSCVHGLINGDASGNHGLLSCLADAQCFEEGKEWCDSWQCDVYQCDRWSLCHGEQEYICNQAWEHTFQQCELEHPNEEPDCVEVHCRDAIEACVNDPVCLSVVENIDEQQLCEEEFNGGQSCFEAEYQQHICETFDQEFGHNTGGETCTQAFAALAHCYEENCYGHEEEYTDAGEPVEHWDEYDYYAYSPYYSSGYYYEPHNNNYGYYGGDEYSDYGYYTPSYGNYYDYSDHYGYSDDYNYYGYDSGAGNYYYDQPYYDNYGGYSDYSGYSPPPPAQKQKMRVSQRQRNRKQQKRVRSAVSFAPQQRQRQRQRTQTRRQLGAQSQPQQNSHMPKIARMWPASAQKKIEQVAMRARAQSVKDANRRRAAASRTVKRVQKRQKQQMKIKVQKKQQKTKGSAAAASVKFE